MQGRECIGVGANPEVNLETMSMFFKSNLDVLARYQFMPTEEVANILPQGLPIRTVLGSGDEGIVDLASAIIDREVQRTFYFGSLAVERPEHQLLLRQNNLTGSSLWFDCGIQQWIDHQRQEMTRKTRAKN